MALLVELVAVAVAADVSRLELALRRGPHDGFVGRSVGSAFASEVGDEASTVMREAARHIAKRKRLQGLRFALYKLLRTYGRRFGFEKALRPGFDNRPSDVLRLPHEEVRPDLADLGLLRRLLQF